ncbi:MAG: TolC family protein [Bacteroidales bacterium]|jgi:outer membrane protein TolC|nr:TolC family protein [Bacteroidales bacterium]
MRGKFFFLLAFLLAGTLSGSAQDKRELSLSQAVEQAVRYNKQLQLSKRDVDLYREKIREAISQGLPQLNTTTNYSTNFNYKMLLGTNEIALEDKLNFTATVSQLVFNGEWIVGIKTSRIYSELAEQKADLTEQDVIKSVVDSYFVVLISERNLDILKKNLAYLEETLVHVQNQYDMGVLELTDVSQIKINVGKLKNSLLSAERALQVNYNVLRLQLGLNADADLRLTDQLDNFLRQDDYIKLATQTFDINLNSEYRIQATQLRLQEKVVQMKKWAYAPTLSAGYSYTKKIITGGFDMSPNHAGQLTLSLPLFTGFKRNSALQQERIILDQARIGLSNLDDALQLNDRQYQYDLKNAMENYRLQKEDIEVARQVLENYQHKYKFGAISSLDLTTANTNYLQAESNFTAACLSLFQAKTKLERLYNILSYE